MNRGAGGEPAAGGPTEAAGAKARGSVRAVASLPPCESTPTTTSAPDAITAASSVMVFRARTLSARFLLVGAKTDIAGAHPMGCASLVAAPASGRVCGRRPERSLTGR